MSLGYLLRSSEPQWFPILSSSKRPLDPYLLRFCSQRLIHHRWFSLVRIWAPWLAPRHGKTTFDLDKDAILSAFVNAKGQHLVLLAISGVNNVMATFLSDESGNVKLHLRNDDEKQESGIVLAAIGHNFESTNAAVMYQARNLVTSTKKSTGEYDEELKALRDGVKPEWMENWYDGLGFCELHCTERCTMFDADTHQAHGTLWVRD